MRIIRWRPPASRVLAEADAMTCLACTGRKGKCTCTRKCGHDRCEGKK